VKTTREKKDVNRGEERRKKREYRSEKKEANEKSTAEERTLIKESLTRRLVGEGVCVCRGGGWGRWRERGRVRGGVRWVRWEGGRGELGEEGEGDWVVGGGGGGELGGGMGVGRWGGHDEIRPRCHGEWLVHA
jgi:hypothetical protein